MRTSSALSQLNPIKDTYRWLAKVFQYRKAGPGHLPWHPLSFDMLEDRLIPDAVPAAGNLSTLFGISYSDQQLVAPTAVPSMITPLTRVDAGVAGPGQEVGPLRILANGQKIIYGQPSANGETDVVLVDGQLPDSQELTQAVLPGSKLFVYNDTCESAGELLREVVNWSASAGTRIRSLTIVGHGVPGAFELGDTWISISTLEQTALAWQQLGQVLVSSANLDLYGCSVAVPGNSGEELIDQVAQLTGAAVFASTNVTGRGGDWVLEAESQGAGPEVRAWPEGRTRSVIASNLSLDAGIDRQQYHPYFLIWHFRVRPGDHLHRDHQPSCW